MGTDPLRPLGRGQLSHFMQGRHPGGGSGGGRGGGGRGRFHHQGGQGGQRSGRFETEIKGSCASLMSLIVLMI